LNKAPAPEFPIPLRKGTWSCTTKHPLAVLSFSHLSTTDFVFVFALSFMSVPTGYHEFLLDLWWKKFIDEKIAALHHNHVWDFTTLPPRK